MLSLNPTPADELSDARGRPYFLWDVDVDLETFRQHLDDSDPEIAAYWASKLMRQAKPDDVFTFLSLPRIAELWLLIAPTLGDKAPFWTWTLQKWDVIDAG